MSFGLRGRMVVASLVLAALAVSVVGTLIVAVGDLRDAADRARQTEAVIGRAFAVEKLVIDLETGHRGLAITGDLSYREPWQAASAALPEEAAALVALSLDPDEAAQARSLAAGSLAYLEDYSARVIALAERDPAAARELISTGEGKDRLDRLRAEFDGFIAAERRLALERDARADEAARRAVAVGLAGLVVSAVLILLFGAYLARLIVAPVRRVAGGARRLAAGDLSGRVEEGGRGETAELARAFNAMATSLEASRDELESQNAELELQAVELERQQTELTAANDELEAQQAELEAALVQVEEEKASVQELYEFSQQVGAATGLDELAGVVLGRLGDFAGADVGALYVAVAEEEGMSLVASRGLDRAVIPACVDANEGLAGRAIAERRLVLGGYGESGLRLPAFGADVQVRHEVNVPFLQGGRGVGVLALARVADQPFGREELDALERFGACAAIGLSNMVALRSALRHAGINEAVLNATTDGIALIDEQGDIVFANRATEELGERLGVRPTGPYRRLAETLAPHTADPDGYLATVERMLSDSENEIRDEYRVADGPTIQRYSAPVRDRAGHAFGRVIVLRDVSAEREADRLKTDFVATVSHELRNPLAGILGFAELLATRDVDPATRERYLATIHGEACRLTDLINDFLDLQRLGSSAFAPKLEPFELRELLQAEIEIFSAQANGHAIRLELPEHPLDVLGERDRVAQVVVNLLSNAVKYSPDGGDVRVSAAADNGAVRVSVADSGIGIPAGQQRHVFEKFFRADSSDTRRIGGTGLGLALCREIVEAHGGRIGFASVEGKGSEFWFELPAGRRAGGGSRSLVVEDDRG